MVTIAEFGERAIPCRFAQVLVLDPHSLAHVSQRNGQEASARCPGRPDCQDVFVSGEKRRRRRLLLTTKTELNAMAAPAMRGLSKPRAARGMAATL